jgi:protein-L-isoaspartate(D-aspartate) O-methyltransferase
MSHPDDAYEALGQFLLTMRTRGLRAARLLEAVERVPRADCVPQEYRDQAYLDVSLPLPCGQETGRPMTIVETVGAMQLSNSHRVLEIGSGCGWQTALIASMAQAVASVERWRTLADMADVNLQSLGIGNAVVVHDDGEGGLPDAAPFDRIIVNAAVSRHPDHLMAQLAPGGQMLVPIRRGGRTMLTRIMADDAGHTIADALMPVDIAVMAKGVPLAL